MGFQIKPADDKFFEHILEITELIKTAAEILETAMGEPNKVEEFLKEIDDLEKQVDELTGKIITRLNKTFITPIDREDIYALANKLDDIMDGIQGVIERMALYNAGAAPDGAKELVDLLRKSARQIDKACSYLPEIKKFRLKLEARCDRIAHLESKGDKIYRQEVARLFRKKTDPVEIIKWKEILTQLEDVLDVCEDVSDLLKGVLLKYA